MGSITAKANVEMLIFSSLVTVVRNLFFSFTVCIFSNISCCMKQDIVIIKAYKLADAKKISKIRVALCIHNLQHIL